VNDHEKLIRQMKRDHAKLIKQFDEAVAQCSVGTRTHTNLLETKSKANERHRAELVKFGVVPQDLRSASKTEFVYIAHCPTVPANRKELEELLNKQLLKACEGLHYSEQDEVIRAKFEEDFPTSQEQKA
jgi:hypothetical protein